MIEVHHRNDNKSLIIDIAITLFQTLKDIGSVELCIILEGSSCYRDLLYHHFWNGKELLIACHQTMNEAIVTDVRGYILINILHQQYKD